MPWFGLVLASPAVLSSTPLALEGHTTMSDTYYRNPDGTFTRVQSSTTLQMVARERGTATGAFVCGIIGTVLGMIPLLFLFAWVLGLIALVLGISAWRRTPRPRLARAATMLGAAALVLGVCGVVIVNNAFS